MHETHKSYLLQEYKYSKGCRGIDVRRHIKIFLCVILPRKEDEQAYEHEAPLATFIDSAHRLTELRKRWLGVWTLTLHVPIPPTSLLFLPIPLLPTLPSFPVPLPTCHPFPALFASLFVIPYSWSFSSCSSSASFSSSSSAPSPHTRKPVIGGWFGWHGRCLFANFAWTRYITFRA